MWFNHLLDTENNVLKVYRIINYDKTNEAKEIIFSKMKQEIKERSIKIEEIFDHLSISVPALKKSMKQLKKELIERLKS